MSAAVRWFRSSAHRRSALAAALVAAVPVLSGCGSAGSQTRPPPAGNRIRGDHLTVYVAVPLNGPSAAGGEAVVDGARRALAEIGGHIGRYRISLRTVDDGGPGLTGWNAPAAGTAAGIASADPTTIGYVGDFNSGASAVSLPILNRLDIAQVSPTSTAVGLTSDGIGSSPGEPQAYYPTPLRTFARVVPSDLYQAEAQVTLQRQRGCHSTYVLDDGEYDGTAAAQAFDAVAADRGLNVVATQSYVPSAGSYISVGQTVASSGADCVLFAAIPDRNAVMLATQVAFEVPRDQLFATMGLAVATFTDPIEGGVPASVGSRLLLTAAAGPPDAAATVGLGGDAEPVTVDGYEATRLLLSAIREATAAGHRQAVRSAVVASLYSGRVRSGPLGRYRIRPDGDTTLNRYGVYRVDHGSLVFWRSIAR